MLDTDETTQNSEVHPNEHFEANFHEDTPSETKSVKTITDIKNLNDLKNITNTQEFTDAKQKVNEQLDHFELLFPTLRKLNDRSIRYKILLDVFPYWGMVAIIVFLSLIFTIFVLVGMFTLPIATKSENRLIKFDPTIFSGETPVVSTIENLSPNNLDLTYSFFFTYNSTFIDIEKRDLKLSAVFEIKKTASSNWTLNTSFDPKGQSSDIRDRTLYCSKGFNYNIWAGDLSFSKAACNRVILSQEKIFYYGYRISFKLLNAKKLYEHSVINGDIFTEFQYSNQDFTIFETVVRSIFSAISIVFAVGYTIVLFKSQQFTKCHTHQKWLVPLLFLHIFYHDPIYWASVFIGYGNIFQIINVVLSLTFVFTFLLYLLIFLHSLFTKPSNRTFFKFYLAKIIIVLVIYSLSMTVIIWSLVYNNANPAHISVTEVPGFVYFQWTVIGFIFLYVLYVLYFVIRAFLNLRNLPAKYSTRFKIVAALSIFVLISFTSVTLLEGRTKFTAPGFAFLLSHLIILVYFCFLGFFFLPSAVPDTEIVEDHSNVDPNGEIHLNPTEEETKKDEKEDVQLNFQPTEESKNEHDESKEFQPYNPDGFDGVQEVN